MKKVIPHFLFVILALLGLTAVSRAAMNEIPFQFHEGFILIESRPQPEAEPMVFLLDSGAGASVLDIRAARKFHIPLGASLEVRGVESRSTAFHIPPIRAIDRDIPLATIALAVDLSNAEKLCGRAIDGIIGVDFFAHRVVQIDFAAHVIRFPSAADPTGAETLPVCYKNGVMCVPISVNGSKVRWTRFDTGCNDSLHWVVPKPQENSAAQGLSIGFLTDPHDQSLTTVRLGRQSLSLVETSLHGHELFPGEAGLLGNGVLARYVVTIDSAKRQILLRAPTPSASR